MTTIVQAATDDEMADARRLMQAFASWRRERHGSKSGSTAVEIEERRSEEELAPPRGRLLIAYEGDQPAGCASLRDFGDGVCAVEQIFVTARFRGQRIGRALVERLILEAKAAGWWRMRLDTIVHEHEVMCLCERAGFHRVDGRPQTSDSAGQHVLFERDLQITA